MTENKTYLSFHSLSSIMKSLSEAIKSCVTVAARLASLSLTFKDIKIALTNVIDPQGESHCHYS